MASMELTFQRASVHLVHDAKRLEEGEDLNDALMDFFVKLGQALIPSGSLVGDLPPVAYLGSLFYDVLRKGGVEDGRAGHANVANWAKRRLGKGGLFADSVGALAVPVNEVLRDTFGKDKERHWWLALLLNPRAGAKALGDEKATVLCLDSFARTTTRYEPPVRAVKAGILDNYPVEVSSLARVGFCAFVYFRAQGDGSWGPLGDPRESTMQVQGRAFVEPELDLRARDCGGEGRPGLLEGTLEFGLDPAARSSGEYILEYGGAGTYEPQLKLPIRRDPTPYQGEVAHFLGGFLSKEWEKSLGVEQANGSAPSAPPAQLRLPDVPQQETSHDCGYFILEQILQALQLTPAALRALGRASTEELTGLPWPSQREVARRKAKLREGLAALFAEARQSGTGDVEALLAADEGLRKRIRAALFEGPSFSRAVFRWMGEDSKGSVSRSHSSRSSSSRSRSRSSSRSGDRKRRKRKRSSSGSGHSRRRRRRRKHRSSSKSSTKSDGKQTEPAAPELPRFTASDLEALPSRSLRTLCVQHGVLPSGMVERRDLLQALAPLAEAVPQNITPQQSPPAQPSKGTLPPPKASVPPPKPPAPPPKASAQQAQAAGLPQFTREELEAMKSSTMRTYCMHHGVLPSGTVERADLIRVLTPFATVAPSNRTVLPPSLPPKAPAPKAAALKTAASVTSRPGADVTVPSRPKFTRVELEGTPSKTLRSYCIHFGVLPSGMVERADLLKALAPFAMSL